MIAFDVTFEAPTPTGAGRQQMVVVRRSSQFKGGWISDVMIPEIRRCLARELGDVTPEELTIIRVRFLGSACEIDGPTPHEHTEDCPSEGQPMTPALSRSDVSTDAPDRPGG